MAWERRQRGQRYYYRCVRQDGVPRKIYLGTGRAAALQAQQTAQRQRERAEEHYALLAEQQRLALCEEPLVAALALAELLVAAFLILSGYHLHRGQWRKRRDMKQQTSQQGKRSSKAKAASQRSRPADAKETETPTDTTAKDQAPAEVVAPAPGSWEHFQSVVQRANQGQPAALALLRRFVALNLYDCQRLGDLAALAERRWLDHVANGNQLVRETAQRQLAARKSELKGAHPTPLESMVVDLVAVTGLATYSAEIRAANPEPRSLAQGLFALRQADSAQKRHFRAVRTLATLRTFTARGLAPLDSVRLFTPKEEIA